MRKSIIALCPCTWKMLETGRNVLTPRVEYTM